QHDQESADPLSWRPRGYLPASRAPQAPKETGGHCVPGPSDTPDTVPHAVVPSPPAQELARGGAGATAPPLCGPRHRHRGASQWRARAPLVSGQEGRLVCGPRRPPDARDEHLAGSSPQRHRPEAVHDEGLPSSRWESSGVSHRPSAPLQPDPIPAPGPERGQVWGGSGRRAIAHRRLDAQLANPHFRRLSVCACTSPPLNSVECGFFFPDPVLPLREPWPQHIDIRSGPREDFGLFFGPYGAVGNPLLRSGLVLAGVNTVLAAAQSVPAEAEDGVFTALDMLTMNLLGTEVVTLSACQTGQGGILYGEGVIGLRRACTLAGARTLVLGLWNVSDKETHEVMERFYTTMIEGRGTMGKAAALRQAQLALLPEGEADPKFWSRFIFQAD